MRETTATRDELLTAMLADGTPIAEGQGMTYTETPPKGAILYALEVPVGQGDTHFANMIKAYEDLPNGLKEAIEGKQAIHDAAHNSAGMLRKGYEETDDPRLTPGAHHPLVREDPATGRRALFLGRRPHAYVIGLEPAESEDLLDRLWAHATQEQYAWVHKWRPGDLLMWQNLWVLHRRDGFEETARRILHRTQIKGGPAMVGSFGPPDRPLFTALGPYVTLAEKLAGQGELGELVVDSSTRTLLAERLSTRSIGAVEVRGLDYPIFAYAAHGDLSATTVESTLIPR